MRGDSHKPNQASSQPGPERSFNVAETEAMETLTGYGIDFIPVYIGRARRELLIRRIEKGGPEPSAEDIVNEVIALKNLDEENREFMERALERSELSKAYETLRLNEPDRIAAQDIANTLREMVELHRLEKGLHGIQFDLFWSPKRQGICLGKARIANKIYQALGAECLDEEGRRVLRIRLRPETRSHV